MAKRHKTVSAIEVSHGDKKMSYTPDQTIVGRWGKCKQAHTNGGNKKAKENKNKCRGKVNY